MFNAAPHKESLGATQKTRIIVCIPKIGSLKTVRHYRPITLLSGDYKIYARIMANRKRQTVSDITHPAQSSSTTDRTILGTVGTIRGVTAHAEITGRPGCLLSIDFVPPFDKISHGYLYFVLEQYGYGKNVVNMIRALHGGMQSKVQINGSLSHSFTTVPRMPVP
jgi:hypothetical protein